ncbi:T6SS lysozyme-like component TssE [Olavius sp. associated proteobacterium Delta 1]|nr:T6SS lysozyme-like component TssE [Olavius sp. associated proteobacterium Delta 1]
MPREFLGRGWKFPVGMDHSTHRVAMSEYEQDVREAIWIILSTAKGERVMRPDFGCGIHELVFAAMNTATIGLVESSVREALVTWEPRVEILDLDVSTQQAHEGKLMVSIDYRVRETNNEFNLVYPFYLTEGI